MSEDWERQFVVARSGLAPALVLVGGWSGEGIAHGEPVTAALDVRAVLQGTSIEVQERVGDHEDVCYYRFDASTGQLRVLHLMAPAIVNEYAVEPSLDGLVWVTPPSAPAVVWSYDPLGDVLTSEVYWPDQRSPEVRIRYRRRPG